jgi:hypothetical protein
MALKVTVRLESRLFQREAFRGDLQQVVTKAAFALEAEAKLRIQQGPKTGRAYARRAITRVVGVKRAKELSGLGFKRARGGNSAKFVVGFRIHRASAPGESPASDSTHLANSIRAKQATSDARGVHAEMIVGANYGQALEEGASGTGKSRTGRIEARPYVAPALEKITPDFLSDVQSLVEKSTQ